MSGRADRRYDDLVRKPGVNVEQRLRVKTCEHPDCNREFTTRAPNRKYCDDHSTRVKLTGRTQPQPQPDNILTQATEPDPGPIWSPPVILRNRARCRKCGETIESTHRHDFRSCKCGAIFVDGGREYIRRGARDFADLEELTEYQDDPQVQKPAA